MTHSDKAFVKLLQVYVLQRRKKITGSAADYIIVYKDFCKPNGDYTKSKQTTLYDKHGGEYCTLLEILSEHFKQQPQPD